MKRRATLVLFVLNACGASAVLFLSITPGLLGHTCFRLPGACAVVPFLFCWFLLALGTVLQESVLNPNRKPNPWGIWSVFVLLSTAAILWFQIPMRIALYLSAPELLALVAAEENAGTRRWKPERRIGPYWIDQMGKDRGGGIYFRTHSGPEGIGSDTMEYGFAYRPTLDGVPFGRSRHGLVHLFGEWYAFEGSTD